MMMSNKFRYPELTKPIRHHNYVLRQIVIVQSGMWVFVTTLTDNQWAEYSVSTLKTFSTNRNF